MNEPQAMPSAPMAEKAILSLMMDRPELFRRGLGEGITEDHFWTYRAFWNAMRDHYPAEGHLDPTVFAQTLHLAGRLDAIGGAAMLSEIMTYAVGNAGGWSAWMGQLREAHARRTAIIRAQAIADAPDGTDALAAAEDALNALREATKGPQRAIDGKTASERFAERLLEARAAGDMPGLPTGIFCLDAITGGMRPGEFWVVGGKPSRGKSVLMLQLVANVILNQLPVVVFSLEMMAHEIIGRMVSCIGRIDHGCITQPRNLKTERDMSAMRSACQTIAGAKLWLDDSANQNPESVRNEACRLRDIHGGMGLVVVDYIQLFRERRAKGESREEQVARASGSLKQLAKELSCPVLSATQLNEQNQSRESRAIEQDADVALYIDDDNEGIRVAKARNAHRGDLLPLHLDGAFQRFRETAQNE